MANARGGVTTNDPADILHVVTTFAFIQAHALSVDESVEFIRKAVTRWS